MSDVDAADDRKRAAGALFNRVWELLDKRDARTPAEDDEMAEAAEASLAAWTEVGGPTEWAIGQWQVSRVNAELGRGDTAVRHAREALALVDHHGLEGFVRASSWEALARAAAVAGDLDTARDARDVAVRWLDGLTDPEDREVLAADIATLPAM